MAWMDTSYIYFEIVNQNVFLWFFHFPESMIIMDWIVFLQNSYVGTLTINVFIFGSGVLGR